MNFYKKKHFLQGKISKDSFQNDVYLARVISKTSCKCKMQFLGLADPIH